MTPSLDPDPQDVLYEFRLVAFSGSYVSDPSNTANVSTSGENPGAGQSPGDWGARIPQCHRHRPPLVSPCPGLEVYPSRTQLPGLLPQPVLAGVVGGVCFLGVAVLVSILAACLMNRRRAARRRRKRLRQGRSLVAPPSVSTSSEKFQPPARARCVPLLPTFPGRRGWRLVLSEVCALGPGGAWFFCHLLASYSYRSTSYLLSRRKVSSPVSASASLALFCLL